MLVERITSTAILPSKAYIGDAGWDLYCDSEVSISPGKRELISTGIKVAIPKGYYGRIADRSSIAWKKGCHVLAGVIDSAYRGEVKILLINLTDKEVSISLGEKIAQLILTKISEEDLIEVDDLDLTQRGEGGFGSSDKK